MKVFVKNNNNNNNKTASKVVQSKKDVDKIESVAIKRTQDKMNVNRFSTHSNVAQQFQKDFRKKNSLGITNSLQGQTHLEDSKYQPNTG